MLLDNSRPGGGGRVAVLARNPTFCRLLREVLAEWHFVVVDHGDASDVQIVERGLTPEAGAGQVIWLVPMPLGGAVPHLEVPLSLIELYHYLEQVFFTVPRRHIRINLTQPVELNVRGVWLVGELLSISDRGARVACPALLPKGEGVVLDFKLAGYPLRVSADILYEIPAGDVAGREQPQAGLLFNPLKPALRLALRRFIEKSFVERACARSGIDTGDASLSWFDLAVNPWEELSD